MGNSGADRLLLDDDDLLGHLALHGRQLPLGHAPLRLRQPGIGVRSCPSMLYCSIL